MNHHMEGWYDPLEHFYVAECLTCDLRKWSKTMEEVGNYMKKASRYTCGGAKVLNDLLEAAVV